MFELSGNGRTRDLLPSIIFRIAIRINDSADDVSAKPMSVGLFLSHALIVGNIAYFLKLFQLLLLFARSC